jgi:hypothetical protein
MAEKRRAKRTVPAGGAFDWLGAFAIVPQQ